MASVNCISLFFFLLLLFTSSRFSFASKTVRSPEEQAEKFMRKFNLFPKHDANITAQCSTVEENEPRLVEKRLILSPLGESGATVEELGQHAGYYRLPNTKDARMFYFFFESRILKSEPVVIWLTGGPGCSSEIALFHENGPFHIFENMTLEWNGYGWDKISNIIFVDQPIGTGFSCTSNKDDIPSTEEGISNDLYNFLQEFFKKHPDYTEQDFYITGESYAGHYIPALAARIHRGNKRKEGIPINLKGFAIGNGLTDPVIQYSAYTDYALDMKLINQSDSDSLKPLVSRCTESIKRCGPKGGAPCQEAFNVCTGMFDKLVEMANNTDVYDIRGICLGNCNFSIMNDFLKLKKVRDALGVGDTEFVSCSSEVYRRLMTDWMRNLEVGIPDLLEDGIKMLIYAGEYDLICNWLGNSRWVHAMKWSGQKQFQAAPMIPFRVNYVEAGLVKSYGPLTFLKVHNAGHMVPKDQPQASLDMLGMWMNSLLP